MIQPDFNSMTKVELRAYVIAHPSDITAFHAFVDRFASEAASEVHDIPRSNAEVEEVETLIRQKLEQLKVS
jgi:dephospho-CoA kinase